MKPKIILTRKLPDASETRMRELFDAELNADDRPFSSEELVEAVRRADVLVPTVTDKIDAALLEQAEPQLKLIASFGAGFDHIDIVAAKAKNIMVTNTPGVLSEDTADVTMALILSVPRRLATGDRLAKSGAWLGWSPRHAGSQDKWKKTWYCRDGADWAGDCPPCARFGISIHYHNRNRVLEAVENELEATYWDDLPQMLGRMDIVSVNCPYSAATKNLLSREMLGLLPAHAYLVNTSRGGIVDQEALAEMLAMGRLAGAGLDVYEDEPHIPQALRDLENVVLLPHIGSATIEGRHAMGDKVIINIQTFLDGHTPPDRVLPAML